MIIYNCHNMCTRQTMSAMPPTHSLLPAAAAVAGRTTKLSTPIPAASIGGRNGAGGCLQLLIASKPQRNVRRNNSNKQRACNMQCTLTTRTCPLQQLLLQLPHTRHIDPTQSASLYRHSTTHTARQLDTGHSHPRQTSPNQHPGQMFTWRL